MNSNGGAILFANTLDGGSQNLSIDSGSGTATFQGALTNMGTGSGAAIRIESTGLVDFQSTVIGAGGIDSTGPLGSTKFSGDVTLASSGTGSTFEGSVNFDGMSWSGFDGLTMNGAATLSSGAVSLNSNNGDITFGDTLDSDATPRDLTLTAGAGNVLFTGLIGSPQLGALTITANNVTVNGVGDNSVGAMTVTNTGLFTTGVGANLLVGGDFSQIGSGSNSIGGDITSVGGIGFATAVMLTNNVTMTSGGGSVGNDIVFGGLLDSDDLATPRDLTLIAGGANIQFLDMVGSNFELVRTPSAATLHRLVELGLPRP
ncbi:MAG: hypothetical protein NTW56_16180 [Alphaproteobacteria bacterium]|nr:hypothetical protein [Alphaproteobacteria bacterium]